jgi:uncharacterized membrane protein
MLERQTIHQSKSVTVMIAAITATAVAEAEALFVSTLQPSENPQPDEVEAAIHEAWQQHGGTDGCACLFAAEYAEHPELAPVRMHWALSLVGQLAS